MTRFLTRVQSLSDFSSSLETLASIDFHFHVSYRLVSPFHLPSTQVMPISILLPGGSIVCKMHNNARWNKHRVASLITQRRGAADLTCTVMAADLGPPDRILIPLFNYRHRSASLRQISLLYMWQRDATDNFFEVFRSSWLTSPAVLHPSRPIMSPTQVPIRKAVNRRILGQTVALLYIFLTCNERPGGQFVIGGFPWRVACQLTGGTDTENIWSRLSSIGN